MPPKLYRIEIQLRGDTWYADFIGDPKMLRAFGQTEIPTAFRRGADPRDVLATITRLNPNHQVTLRWS